MIMMTKPQAFVIAEKGYQVKAYRETYQKHYQEIPYKMHFACLKGHVDELKATNKEKWSFDNALNIPPSFYQWNFESNAVNLPKDSPYQIKKVHHQLYQDILKQLQEIDNLTYLVVGTDDDLEGCYLASAFISTLPAKYQKLPRLRIFTDDLSDRTLFKAFKHLPHYDEPLVNDRKKTYTSLNNSGVLRAQMNYVLGTSLTRALTVKTKSPKPIKVGYVKAPIIQIVNHRYQQYIHFKPLHYYQMDASITHPNGQFKALLVKKENYKAINFKDRRIADESVDRLQHQGTLIKQKSRNVVTPAPSFLDFSQLQSTLNRKYGMDLEKVMQVVEKLYMDKYLTYPRTDCTYVDEDTAQLFPQIVQMCADIPNLKTYAEQAMQLNRFDEVRHDKRYVNPNKIEVHPALTLSPREHEHIAWNELNQNEQRVLYEIALNNLLPFLKPKVTAQTVALFDAQGHDKVAWLAKGSVVIEQGWSALKHHQATKDDDLKNQLPQMQVGDQVQIEPFISEHQTQPKPLYTMATIVKQLKTLTNLDDLLSKEERTLLTNFAQGIGTVATKGKILNELVENGTLMITKSKKDNIPAKKLIPTENGIKLANILDKMQLLQLKDVVQFEMDLTDVQNQELSPQTFQERYFDLAKHQVENVKNNDDDFDFSLGQTKSNEPKIVGHCPICHHRVLAYPNRYACEKQKWEKDSKGQWHMTGCAFSINKKPFNMQRSLSLSNMQKILQGKPTTSCKFLSKNKKVYQAKLKWDYDKQALTLVFDNTYKSERK